MAGFALTSGTTTIRCSEAEAAAPFIIENPAYTVGGTPAGVEEDAIPLDNIPSFGQCMCMDNPENAAFDETGVYAPCVPMTEMWIPDVPDITFQGLPILDKGAKCLCDWGGEISVVEAPAILDIVE